MVNEPTSPKNKKIRRRHVPPARGGSPAAQGSAGEGGSGERLGPDPRVDLLQRGREAAWEVRLRAPRVPQDFLEGGAAAHPLPRPAPHVRVAAPPERRVPGVREGADGPSLDQGYRRHLRPSGARIEQGGGRSARRNRPQPLRNQWRRSDRGSCGNYRGRNGGAEGIRTPDPKTASLVLSQLSYSPTRGITLPGDAEGCQEWYRGRDSNPHALTGMAF